MRKTVDKAGNEGAKKDIKIYVQKIGCEEVIYCWQGFCRWYTD